MVYFICNADGSFLGELNYFLKKVFRRDKCKLCDLSHNLIFQKHSWNEFLKELDHPYKVLHTNELSETIEDLKLTYPAVVLEKDGSFDAILTRKDFEYIDNLSQLKETLKAKIN